MPTGQLPQIIGGDRPIPKFDCLNLGEHRGR